MVKVHVYEYKQHVLCSTTVTYTLWLHSKFTDSDDFRKSRPISWRHVEAGQG